MNRKLLWTGLIIAVLAFAAPKVWAALATVSSSVGDPDVYEINNMTPGSSKTFLGTRLKGILQQGSATEGSHSVGAAIALTATTAVVTHVTGSAHGDANSLADGYTNQEVTFILTTDGGQDWRISPSTKTAFTNVQLNDVQDSVTLKFINSTVGWIVKGNNGAVVN